MSCYNDGRRYFSKNFVLFVLEQGEAHPDWRVGMAVTRKTGSAVKRNRVKRVLREFFRLHKAEMPAGVDIVAVPKHRLDPDRVSLSFVIKELLPLLRDIREKFALEA